jgi:hypothetical protein
MITRAFGIVVLGVLLLSATLAQAEYRAYELEVFDRVSNISQKLITAFSPSDYIAAYGGPERLGVTIRASWICYGDTASYKPVCPMPKAINPQFQEGDRIQIMLPKHLTDQWIGVVENSFFRPGLRSNVYGIRFPERGNLYSRYYEAHLQKAP